MRPTLQRNPFSPARAGLIAVGVALSLAFGVPSADAAPSDLVLASSRPDGTKANGLSFQTSQSLSADGNRIAFQSRGSNLLPADADDASDIFVKDLTAGTLTLVSTNAAGVKGNDGSFGASISADGTIVAFESVATNLNPADTDGFIDVYVKDLTTGALTLASRNAAGVKGNDHISNPSLSADGSQLAFEARASNLVPADVDHDADIYVKDLTTGALTLASRATSGVKGNNFSTMASLAPDGSAVAFASRATNFDPADGDTLSDIYLRDLAGNRTELISATAAGVKGNSEHFTPSVSADGNRVAFNTSSTNLDPADTDVNVSDVYVKDRATGALTLASVTAAGVKAQSGPFFGSAVPSLSADGTSVAFESLAFNLDPADTDSFWDIYAKDLVTGELELMSTTSQNVKSNADDGIAALSPDGSAVGFVTLATNLNPADADALIDVYVRPRGLSCVDFSGSALGFGPNPRSLAGLRVRVTSPPSTSTEIRREQTLRGLGIGRKAKLVLPLPARAVRVTVARFATPVTATAYDADGSVADTATMTGPQATAEELTLHGSDIQVVRLSAPQDEALLERVCAQPICTIVGTNAPDTLAGSPAGDVICARGGDDVVEAHGGDDRVYAGRGADRARGGRGEDRLFGARGDDRIGGGRGDDRLLGARGQDRMRGDFGDDRLLGARGDDRIGGGRGDDRLLGGRSDDQLNGGPGADHCLGDGGVDSAVACEVTTGVP